jgi:hypothetical protein
MASAGLGHMWLSEAVATTADAGSGRETLARLGAEIAALKSAVESSSRSAASQAVKLGNRIDGFERTQAEQAARLAKLADAADRIEHRAPAPSGLAHDVTGSIAAPATQAAAAQPASLPVIQGWTLRGVYNGAALIQRRLGGAIAVMPGDRLPGLGQIESIHRRDGRWVVMTSRGMIVTR